MVTFSLTQTPQSEHLGKLIKKKFSGISTKFYLHIHLHIYHPFVPHFLQNNLILMGKQPIYFLLISVQKIYAYDYIFFILRYINSKFQCIKKGGKKRMGDEFVVVEFFIGGFGNC